MKEKLATLLAIFYWIKSLLNKNKWIRNTLLWIFSIVFLSYVLFGSITFDVLFALFGLGIQLVFALFFMMIQFAGLFWFMSQTRTTVVRPNDPKLISFKDYWGQPHLIKLMKQWLMLLKNNNKFKEMGGKPISGILLSGSPGTGKTLLAKALAGEGGLAFIGVEGSSFRGMFWGMDTLKVISFFSKGRKLAREFGACICVTPETKILTSDLRWVRAKEIKKGDRVIGIDENNPNIHKKRRLREGVVEKVIESNYDLLEIITNKGKITVTTDHPFLSRLPRWKNNYGETGGTLSWTPAKNLLIGQEIKFLCPVWENGDYNSWLSGFIDGKSWLGISGARLGQIGISQKEGILLDKAKEELKKLGFKYSIHKNINTYNINISGLQQILKLLGTVRPIRLLDKWKKLISSEFPPCLPHDSSAKIISISKIKKDKIISLQTSTRTYIADGFISHNCYIDEIDSIGASRGGVQGGQQQTSGIMGMGGSGALTRLLFEMDGLGEPNEWINCQNKARKKLGLKEIDLGHVLIMGSTNRPDVLDPALLRPGRFDRNIQVDPPDAEGRKEIINGYLEKISHKDIDVDSLVADTGWSTPAKLASALQKDSVRIALFSNRDYVNQSDIEKALMEQVEGLQNPISNLEPIQQRQIAVHEAGHAIAQYYLRKDEKIVHLTVTRRTNSLGFMLPTSLTDIYTMPLETMKSDIIISLAGHVAVKLVLGEAWTGASGDLKNVRSRIYQLALHGYFNEFPMTDDILKEIEGKEIKEKINSFMNECVYKTEEILSIHRKGLDALVEELLIRKDMSGKEVVEIIKTAEENI